MRILLFPATICLSCLLFQGLALSAEFKSLFGGKTLNGWTPVPNESASDWSVADGVIRGIGTQKKQVFLVYEDHHIKDFELKFNYRIHGEGNTGVELRSIPDATGNRPFEAYHADIGERILGAWDFHFATRKDCNPAIGQTGLLNSKSATFLPGQSRFDCHPEFRIIPSH
ncbi:MAG: hypothetical protein CMI18_11395 [Opitutaceae bacterium]|nr:hypothetical protein [Opitutaceae bacterium]|tara:strand:- start:3580 stop:4089 length:510 start_codon:yes stop_codon:yes gene_type:complete